jgi:hypothetical protein
LIKNGKSRKEAREALVLSEESLIERKAYRKARSGAESGKSAIRINRRDRIRTKETGKNKTPSKRGLG